MSLLIIKFTFTTLVSIERDTFKVRQYCKCDVIWNVFFISTFNIIYLYYLHGIYSCTWYKRKAIFMLILKLVTQIWRIFQMFDVAILSYFLKICRWKIVKKIQSLRNIANMLFKMEKTVSFFFLIMLYFKIWYFVPSNPNL